MIRKSLVVVGLLLVLALLAGTALANGGYLLWQIGTPNGDVNPIVGAAEYPADGEWSLWYDYNVGDDADPVNAPSVPGYISLTNVCSFVSDGRPCTDTTEDLRVHFDLACDYAAGDELILQYDRYGSETDRLYLDGQLLTPSAAATEGKLGQYTYNLVTEVGDIEAGSHTLRIYYWGGGSANGHYIDYLKLTSSLDPETCRTVEVEIDIKPGSYPSCFNNDGNGVIPVAIFGAEDFDIMTIDPGSVSLEGQSIAMRGKADKLLAAYEDVNGDGFMDLVVKIEDVDGTFTQGSGYATLTGFLYAEFGGNPIEGVGDICITQ